MDVYGTMLLSRSRAEVAGRIRRDAVGAEAAAGPEVELKWRYGAPREPSDGRMRYAAV